MRRTAVTFPLMLALAVALACCSGDDDGPTPDAGAEPDAPAQAGDVESVFILPRAVPGAFFDLPYPSDLNRTAPVGIDLSAFPNPVSSPQIQLLVDLLREEVDGFSTNGTLYARFSGAIDEATLPDPASSVAATSSVQLIALDAGQRLPVEMRFQAAASDYWADNVLAVRPVGGFVLQPATRYALVVTSTVRAADGSLIRPGDDLAAMLGHAEGDLFTDDARDRVYGPAVTRLAELGLPAEQIISLAVFTTMDPVSPMFRAAAALVRDVAAPEVTEIFRDSNRQGYTAVIGHYGPAPFYQSGAEPFDELGSGRMLFEGGEPVLQREDELRFAVAVPEGEVPAGGFPLALYSHGTGGDYKSFMEDGTAERLAAVGIASIGFDQVLHGERAPEGTVPENTFFNFLNPVAGRDNNRQAVLDNVQQARLAANLVVPSDLLPGNADAFFDPTRQVFFGHSQGGLNGSLFLAVDDAVRGAVLSGTGGNIGYALLLKRQPTDILALVEILLDLDAELEHFDIFHPLLTLLQTFIDPADPLNYAPYWYATPRAGAGRSVLMTEGLLDDFAPTPGIEALAVAGHLPIVDPIAQPVLGLDLLGIPGIATPVSGNVQSDQGDVFTAGLLQVPGFGHHVIFEDEATATTVTAFVQSLASAPPGVIQ